MKDGFHITITTIHVENDKGEQHNVRESPHTMSCTADVVHERERGGKSVPNFFLLLSLVPRLPCFCPVSCSDSHVCPLEKGSGNFRVIFWLC